MNASIDVLDRGPLVSIAIAAYNRAHLIDRTLDSLLRQTVQDFEILISDDASSDGSRDVCERYAAADARIRYFRNGKRLGLGGNCSRVLSMTHGEFVILAGDDDIYEPNFLERLLAEMRRFPSLSLVACRVDLIDQNDVVVREMSHQYFAAEPLSSRLRNANRMLWCGYGNLMTGMYRRELMMRTLLYRPILADEWDEIDLLFLFEMALQGCVVSIPDVLLHKRVGGVSSRIPYRTFSKAVPVYAAAGRAYAVRIRRSMLPGWQKALLYGSLASRWTFANWEWKKYLAYTLLVTIDPKRHIRRHLRRVWEKRFAQRSARIDAMK
jgi:glycosyltransferase involved in cell wall biosynthesis